VEITGPDAFRFTNMLTPRNLERCAVGQCKYAFITDERGGIINDPVLLRLGENHFWLSLADSDVLLWAKGVAYHAGMDVTITEPDGLAPIGPCHIRRSEGGILAHGCDMTIEENPYEVGYGYKWMVELEQEQDFIGRDALREVATRGVSRKLVGVELGGSRLGAY